MKAPLPSRWDPEEFQRRAGMTARLLACFIEESRSGTPEVVKIRPIDAILRDLDLGPFLENGDVSDSHLEWLLGRFLHYSTRLEHPSYMAHQVALPHYGAALADFVSGTINNGMSVYEMGPAAGAIEVFIIDWMLQKAGWQPTGRNKDLLPAPGASPGGGVLTHGGTLANLTALLAARAAVAPDSWEAGVPQDLVLLVSESAHYSISRAAAVMGLGTSRLVKIPTDSFGRILTDELPSLYEQARSRGQRVMAVCANACSTATGLFDPLAAIGTFCREHGLWFHVDGAHGASLLLHPVESKKRLFGLDLTNSFIWDAHKLLQTSALATAVLFRDQASLAGTFRQRAVYVTEGHRETGSDFIEQQFECTKAPLGLKLFLTLAIRGEKGIAAHIESLFSLTSRVHGQITRRPGFETLCPPETNILCFRKNGDDALQSAIRNELLRRGDYLVSQADVAGRRWLRLTLMNSLTGESTIESLLDTIDAISIQGQTG